MALLFVSASVLVIGFYLNDTGKDFEEDRVDRTAAVLSESTISVAYSLEDTQPIADQGGDYTRVDYGSGTGLLANAAITNLRIDDTQIYEYGPEYQNAVDASVSSTFVGSNHNVYVVAEWRPYDDASIGGVATAGQRPPSDADVGSVTMTASSGIDQFDEEELVTAYNETDNWFEDLLSGYDPTNITDDSMNQSLTAVGMILGEQIVEGYFPERPTQIALESQGVDRDLTVHAYERMVGPLEYEFSGNDNPDTHPPLLRSEADAIEANQKVLRGYDDTYLGTDGLGHWLGDDLYDAFADDIDEMDATYADDDDRDEAIGELLAEEITLDEVQITIQTWER